MIFVAIYMIIGLVIGRVVRSRVNIAPLSWKEEHHVSTCPRRRSADAGCIYSIICKEHNSRSRTGPLVFLLATPFIWPLVLLAGFLLVEKLPKPSALKTKEEKFIELLASDSYVRNAYEELCKTRNEL